jgi:hypothetical protein
MVLGGFGSYLMRYSCWRMQQFEGYKLLDRECGGSGGRKGLRFRAVLFHVWATRPGHVLSCRWVGLVDGDGVALRVLTEGKPCDTGDSHLRHECLSAVLLDEIGVHID